MAVSKEPYRLLALKVKSPSLAKPSHSSTSTWTYNVLYHASPRLLLHLQLAESHHYTNTAECTKVSKKILFHRQRAQFKHHQHNKIIRFSHFISYKDPLLKASAKPSNAKFFHYRKHKPKHEKKPQYTFFFSVHVAV